MRDLWGRDITYMRVSVTDRCNLRCRYCMPDGIAAMPRSDILSYEEILRVCGQAAALGITSFRVTGGEPLARRDVPEFLRALKNTPGVKAVALTTNGLLLEPVFESLRHLDGINVSLDALDPDVYCRVTGSRDAHKAVAAVRLSCEAGIPTRINAVLLEETRGEWMKLLALAEELPISVRFIELMPVGGAEDCAPVPIEELLKEARRKYPDLTPLPAQGNGPARYLGSAALKGSLGYIAANSHKFCQDCNRMRLTSAGQLRGCLGRSEQTDMRRLLRGGASDDELREALAAGIRRKPAGHEFERTGANPAPRMNEIGG